MSPVASVGSWELPGDPGEVLAVFVDGVELARGDWTADGARVRLREPIPVTQARRGEVLAAALAWVGRYPPPTAVTALVRRPDRTDVVDASPVGTP